MVAKPNEACLYTMTIPMYLAWNGFPICKLQRVIRQQIFLIHCAPSPPTCFQDQQYTMLHPVETECININYIHIVRLQQQVWKPECAFAYCIAMLMQLI